MGASIDMMGTLKAIEDYFKPNRNTDELPAPLTEFLIAVGVIISSQPSAQPEVVTCKDCIHWWESHKMCKRNKDKNHNCACMDCDADFYCKNAERRIENYEQRDQ